MTPAQIRAMHQAVTYKDGSPAQLHEAGVINLRPHGPRLLLRAILAEDAFAVGQDIPYDARGAVAHEVIAVGAGCAKWYDDNMIGEADRVKVGQHVFIVAAAADRASKTDRAVRIWICRVDHIVMNWDVPR